MRTIATITSIGACLVAVLTTGGCDGSASPQGPDAPAGEQSAQQWTMPDLVGATLQDAQDQIQALTDGTVYSTDSHDLTGADGTRSSMRTGRCAHRTSSQANS
ncbi:hypothetical protein [Actinophytocola sp.]|uniref:hypothetical protein n=1 Tax=Actinophytocola sp. TaxID=1872138 RepID=UPI002ED3CE25